MRKKIDKYYIYIILIALFFVFVVTPSSFLFGSTIDWVSQHIAFPDYFRKLFYETGNLFPNFAFSIGGGQNIFHFSYYGLFNPFVIFSYLFPFIDMTSYLIGMNIILYIFSALLLYKWLKRHFTQTISFLGSILLLCAAPFLFHFHRHFMFVSYMPFLILGLMGVEDYFEKNRKFFLIFSTFFIILMSYFYSIPCILVFVLYGVFSYLKREDTISFLQFIKDGLCFVFPIFIGILLAAFFLLPTFYTVLSGRGGGDSIAFGKLFLFQANIGSIVYDHYGIGLTSLAVLSLLYGLLCKKREYKFLSISLFILLCFPIFSYLLNGTLYVRNKVFIPFLPLFLFIVCHFIRDILEKKISYKFYFLVFFSHILFLVFGFSLFLYYVDVCLTVCMVWFFQRKQIEKLVYLFLCIPVGVLLFVNHIDEYVKKDVYDASVDMTKDAICTIENDDSIYRTYHLKNGLYNVNKVYGSSYYVDSLYSSIYHEDYRTFYKDIFKNPLSYRNRLVTSQNNNLLYQMYMGGKYLYSDKKMIGYKKIGNSFYKNEDVFPLFYVSEHFLGEEEFDDLEYPYTVLSLLQNTIIKGKSQDSVSKIDMKEVPFYHVRLQHNLKVIQKKGGYKVIAKDDNKLVLSFDRSMNNQILLLDFWLGNEWDCKNGDSSITINDIKNTFTCKGALYKNGNKNFHYVLSDPTLKEIEITFHKGEYFIRDIHVYRIDYDDINKLHKSFIGMKIDKKKTKGDKIVGTIDVKKDGYFVTSIPYDKGFTIYDNGKKVSYEKVNKAFLGFKIKKGSHFIQMEYRSPYFFLGKCVSVFTLLFLCIYYYIIFRNNYKKNEYNKMTMKKVKKL